MAFCLGGFMFTFGSDPEFFLMKNNQLKSAIGILPDKENKITNKNCSYYYDNVLVEMQINPSDSKYQTIHNFNTAIHSIAKELSDYTLTLESANWFPDKELQTKESRIAGCNPEYCAYSLQQVLPPQEIIETTGFRTAGGHIHLGNHEIFNDSLQTISLVRMLDLFLGIPSVLLDHDVNQIYRRKIYGHAGSHRLPEHGLEYRCLGNFWLKSPKLVELIYDITKFTINFVSNHEHDKFWTIHEDLIDEDDVNLAHQCHGYDSKMLQNCINSCDRKQAENFMNIVNCQMPNYLIEQIMELQNMDFNFYEEWKINV